MILRPSSVSSPSPPALVWLLAAAACGGNTGGASGAAAGGISGAVSASGGGSPSAGGAGASVRDAGAADGGSALASGAGSAGPTGAGPTAGAGPTSSAPDAAAPKPADAAVPDEPGAADSGASPAACGRCTAYAAPMRTGTVEPMELNALSGLTLSRAQPEILFAHNDHDRAVIYALDLQGRLHARITLDGATATDIEDIALGPCAAYSCIYLGDIGDNAAQRAEYAILRIPEPTVPAAPGNSALSSKAERYRFTYEDGSHNAESLMVAPDGALYVVTKLAPGSGGRVEATGASSVYKLTPPLSIDGVARATKVATLPAPAAGDQAASAAAAHPCGLGFLLRTYNRVYEFQAPEGASFEAAFQATPKVVAMPDEPQSEGIDYRPGGRGFVTSGEGTRAPIFSTDCNPSDASPPPS